MTYETKLFINNEYISSKDGKTFPVSGPTSEKVVANVHSAGPADIDLAVDAAQKALKGPWRTMKNQERAATLNRFADLLDRDAEALALAETVAMGVPVTVGIMLIRKVSAPAWRYYAGWCDKLAGESYPIDGDDDIIRIVKHEPLGVCAALSAWNGTQLMVSWKVGAAVAAGNAVIHKASEKSPLGALMMGKLVIEAGFPPGVINFVSGAGDTGALLSSHMKIASISFTGSVETARRVQDGATKSNLKRCTLELGGKSPSIVFDDADLDLALTMNSQMFLMGSSQACIAGSRVFVHTSIAKKFQAGLKERFEQLTQLMGDPTDPKTYLGPLADKQQFDRVMGFIDAGKAAGIEVLTGGTRKGETGFYMLPTIFLNPDVNHTIYRDEIFGPVLTIKSFETEEEAIELANDTTYGLGAYVYTNDLSRALRVSNALEAGSVGVNTTSIINLATPFGGYKQSGVGKESGLDGLLAYLNKKTISIKVGKPCPTENDARGRDVLSLG